jgi:hypothetical protein
VEGKCGRKMGSTLGPNFGPRARVLLTHLNSFPLLVSFQLTSELKNLSWNKMIEEESTILIFIDVLVLFLDHSH